MKKRRNEIKKSDIFSHWVNIDYLPRWGVLLLDLLIAMIAFVISAFIGENVVGYDFTTKLPIWEQAAILLVVQCIFNVRRHHEGRPLRRCNRYNLSCR